MPAISVIVPVYQAEAFLQKCTDSILGQTFGDLELLLIDDGSPDGSGVLCDAIAAKDDRVRVFHKENGGVSTARNLGLIEARGEYIAFADSDDWLASNCLETLYNALHANQADSAGCAHWNAMPSGENIRESAALPQGVYDHEAIMEGLVYPLVGNRVGAKVVNGFIWRYLYTARLIQAHQVAFEGAYLEDELFLIEYFCQAQRLAIADQPLYYYLQNPTSVTHKYMKNYLGTFRRFMERKEAIVARCQLEAARPQWREESNYASLLIAIGNEYATGNPASWKARQDRVRAIVDQPEMQKALRALHPQDQSRNKRIVDKLIRSRRFSLLTALYRLKNRG